MAPPVGVGTAVETPSTLFATDQYRVSLTVEGWYPQEQLEALATWCCERLVAADESINVLQPLDMAVVREARGEDPALSRSRARMLRMVRTLQQKGRFNGWRYGGTRPAEDGKGVIVDVVGPEGFQVHLNIEIGVRDGKSQVQATFSLGNGTEPEVARPAVEEITATLREAERSRRRRA